MSQGIAFFYLLSNFEHQRRIRAIVRVRVVRRVEAKSPHASPYTSEPEKSKGQIILKRVKLF